MTVHRLFYPNQKPGESRASVRHIAEADNIVTPAGVRLIFTDPDRHYTPDELKMLARWLYSLSHEATDLAAAGLVDAEHGYDVETETKVAVPAADE